MTTFRQCSLALVTSGVLLLAGCSNEPPAAQRTSSSDGSVSLDTRATPAAGPAVLAAGTETLEAGIYVLDLDARSGSGDELFPNVTITVPDGWNNIDGWGVNSGTDGDHWMGITFWDVDEVFAHPCQWQGRRIQPGPTVAGLAKALVKRPLRNATAPEDIRVDGFRGIQLEWSVPALEGKILRAGGQSYFDFSTCDEAPEGDHPFMSWTAAEGSWASDRYQQGPGQVDRLWILDVDGERLVVDAMYMPSTNAKDRDELWRVMESIRFDT